MGKYIIPIVSVCRGNFLGFLLLPRKAFLLMGESIVQIRWRDVYNTFPDTETGMAAWYNKYKKRTTLISAST